MFVLYEIIYILHTIYFESKINYINCFFKKTVLYFINEFKLKKKILLALQMNEHNNYKLIILTLINFINISIKKK